MMKNLHRRIVMTAVAGLAVATSCLADATQDAIDYRQHIMEALNQQSAVLGQIVSGAVPNDNLTYHLDSIASLAGTALKSFEAKAPGGKSSPEVWKNWQDFSARMKEFADKTAAAAKLAHSEEGPETALVNMLDAMGCKGCHDVYRVEK